MKIEQILELIKAGYTKDEINALQSEPVQAEVPATPEVVSPAEPEKPQENINNETLMKVLDEMAKLKAAVQSSNISNTYRDSNPEHKPSDILATLISSK